MIVQVAVFVVVVLGWCMYKVQLLLNKKQPQMAGLYACLMGVCMLTGSLLFAKVNLPSPTIPVRMIFEPIGRMLLK